MTDRLAELRRQRALVAEHLAWLDREIGALVPPASSPAGSAIPPATVAKPPLDPAAILAAATAQPPTEETVHVTTDTTLPPLPESRPTDIRQEVRRGCLVYFVVATLVVIAGGALLVWASRAYNATHSAPTSRAEAR